MEKNFLGVFWLFPWCSEFGCLLLGTILFLSWFCSCITLNARLNKESIWKMIILSAEGRLPSALFCGEIYFYACGYTFFVFWNTISKNYAISLAKNRTIVLCMECALSIILKKKDGLWYFISWNGFILIYN